MDEQAGLAVSKLRERFAADIIEAVEFRGETTVAVKPARIVDICRFLRDDAEVRFAMLLDVTAADYVAPRQVFTVVYHLFSFDANTRLRLKADVPSDQPRIHSVAEVWPAADWHEREVFDLFGIEFEGHPDLRRILMPEDFDDHPLRKEYPLHGR